ncbi:unnamed protein product [Medioppia subpectinata]|uniref:YEATS domain-containing protein n=1 Tax=Medioppia subpectinata TaxID=1979941 RepID=A0A7R9KFM5_9ACAR|nr:unnamed protein product [Medioppia subpectinata]CAG2102453.1 unnamed protein product [Medioppia subpectinata]
MCLVLKEPPYQVSESGYAGFELPIEVYFKNKEEPKKISFEYDLYLRLDDAVSNCRREKLTFQNPSNDFKKKLLKAGGVSNESNGSSVKTSSGSEEKSLAQQTSTSNNSKYSTKSLVTGNNESKKSKITGVIPSKDKSLIKSQNTTTTSSSNPSVASEKQTIQPIAPSNNRQFTDLFGDPIHAKTSTDSAVKNKDNLSKNKYTAIASKGVKNDSKSLHKNSSKNSYLSPTHKIIDKSSKETKESKDSKSKESTKSKREEELTPNKSKKKNIQSSPKPYDISSDNKNELKSSKKRRNSSTFNSSLTPTTEPKVHKESQKLNSIKDKDNKKESKRQKNSSKDVNSGVKKQSSTSTKISFSDNNSSTTIEIKSVKKEKTWDSESKKSRTKDSKSAKDKLNSNANTTISSSLNANKVKPKPEPNYVKSPKVNGSKHMKASKDKYGLHTRERSSSPSSASLTPPSNDRPLNQMAAEIESHESMSPASSDNSSTSLGFEPIRPNRKPDANSRFILDDSDSSDHSVVKQSPKRSAHLKKNETKDSQQNRNDSSKMNSSKRKKDLATNDSNKRMNNSKEERSLNMCPDFDDSVLDLIQVQKKINESTNTDLLQKIVDTIEESSHFDLTETTFTFDLMRLDDKTVRKLKSYLS